jgi:hypothetical protein
MEVGTWLSVVILGPGAIVIFIWFLWDFARMWREKGGDSG